MDETFTAPFTVLHHDAVKAYEPYDKIVKPLPDMRRETVKLVRHANAGNLRAYVRLCQESFALSFGFPDPVMPWLLLPALNA